ncbi:peptide ABC transporter substrate-binding protein [Brevibacterium sp. UCMA 11754]|uniref:peptide ABC transporter substrate-binding protein n=1 Tax=Brevibacterium sp. UCMA 11754 TaxID=2749198 RepID=UPI001F2B5E65|nr:ABC transporter substrate-binding protein [Brevibacterium sp. UCMA 11754]MCF2573529.1 ABC transporter substrate-binding protein [Brevibacterium sp. UCMA 11754]
MRTLRFSTIAALVITLTLSACSSGGSDEGDRSISVGVTDPTTLVPARQSVAFDFSAALWSPLTFVESDGKIDYIQAKSIESDDSVTWTITLRDGWTFHDGTPVTAQSYIDSWNAAAYGPNAFENAGQLANIVGFDDLNPEKGEPSTKKMSGLHFVDDLTFTVELKDADSQFPLQVSQAQTAMFPMPESAMKDFDAYTKHPVGNGPFEMDGDYAENQPFTVTANDDYAGDAPTVDSITFKPYTDLATAYTDVRAGNLDIASVPPNRLPQSEADFGDSLYTFDAPGISYLGLPLWDARYKDVKVRQAISMAIDRDSINDVIYGGQFVPADAFTPAVEPGTPDGLCGDYCKYDPETAKKLLDEAGGFDGAMEIYYPGGGGYDDLYNAIANNLRQNLGVDATARPSADWAEFLDNRTAEKVDGPFFSRWGALYPSQQATLRSLFIKDGGCANCVPWYTEDIASAIRKADKDDDGTGEAYADVQDLLLKDFPAPPLFFETYSYVTSDKIADLPTSPVGNPQLTKVKLAD